jgi:tRNA threonylcarbamoyladenosine biosynthesis protein TsaB
LAMEWALGSREGWSGVRIAGQMSLDVEATHSEKLLWGVDQVLSQAAWKLDEVHVLGVGMGPGSFTGLRIGMTTARTLAHTLGKPLIGVSSLAALARPIAKKFAEDQSHPRTWVIATTDACKGELFALWGSAKTLGDCVALASGDQPGLWKRGAEEQVITPTDLVKTLSRKLSQPRIATSWCVVGEGRHRYLDQWQHLPQDRRLELPQGFSDHVQPEALGQLVWEADQAGLAREALSVHPRYLRASDAELKLKAGLLKAGPTRGV